MLKIFRNTSELADAFCDVLLKSVSDKDEIFIALSGGSTPKIIFQTLAKDYKDKIDWTKINLFWSDERCVPPDDDESNYRMTKKYLFDLIEIPEKNIHRIRGENEPVLESIRYSKEITDNVPFKEDLPLFDIVMLGLGEDGHTASIFPDQMKLLYSEKICEVAVHPSSKQKRITLTGKVLNNAEQVIFLITGRNKAFITKEILESKKNIYPAEFIKPVSGGLQYFIDAEASELLNKKNE